MASPLINGKSYSYVDLVVVIAGVPVFGIDQLTYESTQEKTNNYGASALPVSRGRGKKEFTGSVTLSMNEIENIRDAIDSGSLLDVEPFDIQVTYINPQKTVTHILKNCEFTSDGADTSEGDTKIAKQLNLIMSHINYN